MSEKVAAIVRSYGLTKWLKQVLLSLADLDLVVLANARFNGVGKTRDDTERIFKELGQGNITLIKSDGGEQHDLFNSLLQSLCRFKFVFINDADEFISRFDRGAIVSYLSNNDFDGGTCNIIDYKTGLNRAYRERTHRPTVVVKPHVRFFDTRGADYSNHYFKDIYLHHFGYHDENDLHWKRDNLWYKKESMDKAMVGEREVTPPSWLEDMLEDN